MRSYKFSRRKKVNKAYLIIGFLLLLTSFVLIIFNNIGYRKSTQEQSKSETEIVQNIDDTQSENSSFDYSGAKLTTELKKVGLNLGFVGSDLYKSLGYNFPSTTIDSEKPSLEKNFSDYIPLEQIIQAPATPSQQNRLIWPEYEIDAPIIYASFEDIFAKNTSFGVSFNKFINNNPVESPVQVKLRDGIVHLPFSPSPGEQGNSYIIGHSSNYNNVKSDYNYVFSKIVDKVQKGETFKIFDYKGRELTFRVIETLVLGEKESTKAYKQYGNKRVVSLQGSILESVKGKFLPTKRYIVVGELQEN
jgi:sortase (surface protein transpeptidase)